MVEQFKKGQLVAVRAYSDEAWEPAIFERIEGKYFICRSLLNRGAWLERPWMKAKPAEDVWPNIFLGWERRAREQSDHALEMESALVQRLRKQIEWLCKELEERKGFVCPPKTQCVIQKPCRVCWEEASLKAVEKQQ